MVATRLDKTLRRELELHGRLHTVSLSPEGIRIVAKGRRKGREISWQSLLSGEVELRQELKMSLEVLEALRGTDQQVTGQRTPGGGV